MLAKQAKELRRAAARDKALTDKANEHYRYKAAAWVKALANEATK